MSLTDQIDVFIQNSIRIRGNGRTIYIDPFRMKEEPHDADFIFITHDHYDHFSAEDIMKVAGGSTTLILPARMEEKAAQVPVKFSRVYTVTPGTAHEVDGCKFETVPAYNNMKPFHPRSSGWVGYIFDVEGKRVYVAGDTDATREAQEVRCDIALVPIGGTYTMDASKAAGLINIIRPEVAIPVHFGSLVGDPSDADTFASLVESPVEVVRKIEF